MSRVFRSKPPLGHRPVRHSASSDSSDAEYDFSVQAQAQIKKRIVSTPQTAATPTFPNADKPISFSAGCNGRSSVPKLALERLHQLTDSSDGGSPAVHRREHESSKQAKRKTISQRGQDVELQVRRSMMFRDSDDSDEDERVQTRLRNKQVRESLTNSRKAAQATTSKSSWRSQGEKSEFSDVNNSSEFEDTAAEADFATDTSEAITAQEEINQLLSASPDQPQSPHEGQAHENGWFLYHGNHLPSESPSHPSSDGQMAVNPEPPNRDGVLEMKPPHVEADHTAEKKQDPATQRSIFAPKARQNQKFIDYRKQNKKSTSPGSSARQRIRQVMDSDEDEEEVDSPLLFASGHHSEILHTITQNNENGIVQPNGTISRVSSTGSNGRVSIHALVAAMNEMHAEMVNLRSQLASEKAKNIETEGILTQLRVEFLQEVSGQKTLMSELQARSQEIAVHRRHIGDLQHRVRELEAKSGLQRVAIAQSKYSKDTGAQLFGRKY